GSAHGRERLGMRPEALERECIAQVEAQRPLAIPGSQLAQERRLHPAAELGAGAQECREGAQERPRRALTEERARVHEAHALAAGVREPVELVEIAAVG